MTLLLALMLIIGLNMSFWWLVPVVIIYLVGMSFKDDQFKTIAKNQMILNNKLDDLKKD